LYSAFTLHSEAMSSIVEALVYTYLWLNIALNIVGLRGLR